MFNFLYRFIVFILVSVSLILNAGTCTLEGNTCEEISSGDESFASVNIHLISDDYDFFDESEEEEIEEEEVEEEVQFTPLKPHSHNQVIFTALVQAGKRFKKDIEKNLLNRIFSLNMSYRI